MSHRYTFQCGNGSSMTVEAESIEEAISKFFQDGWDFNGSESLSSALVARINALKQDATKSEDCE